jgi:broad-specificity NMP kinase
MTTNQENKLTMCRAVITYLNQHETMLNGLPHFTECFTQLKDLVNQIEENKKNQETQITGITKQKNEWRDKLIELAGEIANKVKVYAIFAKNTILKEEVDYKDTDLRKVANNVLKDRAQIIYDKALENMAQLADYRVNQELLDNLAEAIQKFTDAMPNTRVSQVSKKGTTINLKNAFAEIDDLLKQRLDGLLLILKKDEAQFYTGYSNARIIIDLKGRGKNKEEANAVDAQVD